MTDAAQDEKPELGWTITWGTRTWLDSDVLGRDVAAIQLLIGGSWESCNPLGGPLQLMAMIAALEARSSGRDLDEVMIEIRESPAEEVMGAITTRAIVEAT